MRRGKVLRKAGVLAFAILLTLWSQSCNRSQNLIKVGVSIPQTSQPIYSLMKTAMREKQQELKVEVIWNEANRPKDNLSPGERELQNVKDMIALGIRSLIYKPLDPNSTFAVLKDARTHNIGVIAIDDLPVNLPIDGYITIDQSEVGRLQAEYIVDKIGGSGKVIVLENPADPVARQVASGIYEVFDQYFDDIQVIPLTSKKDENQAFKLVSDTISKYAGNIQAVAACQSQLAAGATKAIHMMNLDKNMVSVGTGASKTACAMILNGTHDMEVDQMPYERAVMALNAAFIFAFNQKFEYDEVIKNGEAEVKVKYAPIRPITKDNVHLMQRMWPDIFGNRQ